MKNHLQVFDFEEQSAEARFQEVSAITSKAVEEGLSYSIRLSREGDWYRAMVTVYPAGVEHDL